jgi:hypothetical protein
VLSTTRSLINAFIDVKATETLAKNDCQIRGQSEERGVV